LTIEEGELFERGCFIYVPYGPLHTEADCDADGNKSDDIAFQTIVSNDELECEECGRSGEAAQF
jgi:hypothetical protein